VTVPDKTVKLALEEPPGSTTVGAGTIRPALSLETAMLTVPLGLATVTAQAEDWLAAVNEVGEQDRAVTVGCTASAMAAVAEDPFSVAVRVAF
jgi:hypothetical protein